jgi:hypothetical protein
MTTTDTARNPPSIRATATATAVVAWAAAPALYAATLWAAARIDEQPLGSVLLFDPWTLSPCAFLRLPIAVLGAVAGVLVLFVIPWLLGRAAFGRIASRQATAGAWSLAMNSAALVLVMLVLRGTVGIQRGTFLATWLAWTVVLVRLAGGPEAALASARRLAVRWNAAIWILLAAAAASILLFGRQQFGQCFEGDGTEVFELARSLRTHFLPYWEIDSIQKFGNPIVYPAMIDSYWTLAMQLLLGPGEFATRLMFWIWWPSIFCVSVEMAAPWATEGDSPIFAADRAIPKEQVLPATKIGTVPWLPALSLALAMFLMSIWYTFYTGYNPYMTDMASPGVPDGMLTVLVLLALNCMRLGDLAGWAVMLAICALTSYVGPVAFVLSTAAAFAWQPVPWRQMPRAAVGGAMLLGAIGLAYLTWGWWNDWILAWRETLVHESFEGYHTQIRPSASAMEFLVYFTIGCGGIAVLGLVWPLMYPARSACRFSQRHTECAGHIAWRQTAATVALAYLLIVLGARCRNLHYLGPIIMFPLILWCQGIETNSRRRLLYAATVVSLLACIALCWPASRPQFTLSHELGQATTFQTDSYEEAVRWAPLVHPLWQRHVVSWKVEPHTWVLYAELAAKPAVWRPLVVNDGPPPTPEYWLLDEWPERKVKLYCRDPQWAARLVRHHPPIGPDRVPWLLRAAAVSPD